MHVGSVQRVTIAVGLLEHGAAEQISQFGVVQRLALARLYEIAFQHFVGFIVDLNFDAFFEFTGGNGAHVTLTSATAGGKMNQATRRRAEWAGRCVGTGRNAIERAWRSEWICGKNRQSPATGIRVCGFACHKPGNPQPADFQTSRRISRIHRPNWLAWQIKDW